MLVQNAYWTVLATDLIDLCVILVFFEQTNWATATVCQCNTRDSRLLSEQKDNIALHLGGRGLLRFQGQLSGTVTKY